MTSQAYPKRDMQKVRNPYSPNRKQVFTCNVDRISLVSKLQARGVVDAHDGVPGIVYKSKVALLCRRLPDEAA